MIRRNAFALAVIALAPLSGAQAADRLSYSYLDAQYLNTRFDLSSGGSTSDKDTREGIRLGLDIGLAPYLFVKTDYDQRMLPGLRWSYGDVGLGVHTLARRYQVFGIATYEHRLLHVRGDSTQDDRSDGYGLEVGGRVPWDIFELHAAYKYMDFGKTELGSIYKTKATRYGGGVAVQLTPWFALTGDWRHIDHDNNSDDTATAADVKWNFDEWLVGFRSYFATDADKYQRHEGIFGSDKAEAAQ